MSKISTKEIVKLLTLSTILVLLINFNVISGEINLTQTDQPIIIGSDSDFASYDLTGDGTTVDPFVISDLNFFPLDAGIVIENTTLAVIIMNNAFDGGDFGISIRNSTGIIEIINNQFVTGNKGIYVGSSNNIIIHNNSFTSFSDDAINVEDSNNIEIIGNYIQEAEIGLRLETSEDLEVVNNTISLSTRDGMRLNNISNIDLISNLVTQNNDDGIRMNLTNNVLFRDNFVIENTDGIRVDSSSDLVFEHNKMELNIEKGLRFQSSDTISVLSNLFINNGRQGLRFYNLTFQAVIFNNVFFGNNGADRGERDDSLTSGNTWYDINNEIGNYYQEFDDRAYEIKGDAEEIDFYPLEFIPSEVEDLIVGQESFRRPEPSSIGQNSTLMKYISFIIGILLHLALVYLLYAIIIDKSKIGLIFRFFGFGNFFANVNTTRHLIHRSNEGLEINKAAKYFEEKGYVLLFPVLTFIAGVMLFINFIYYSSGHIYSGINYFFLFFGYFISWAITTRVKSTPTPFYGQSKNGEADQREVILTTIREIAILLIDDVKFLSVNNENLGDRNSKRDVLDQKQIGSGRKYKTKSKYSIDNFLLRIALLDDTILDITQESKIKEKHKTKKGNTRLLNRLISRNLGFSFIMPLENSHDYFHDDESEYEAVIENLISKKFAKADAGLFNYIRFKKSKNNIKVTIKGEISHDKVLQDLEHIIVNIFEVVSDFKEQYISN